MAQEIKIQAAARTVHGSSASRRIRRAGGIPAVLATLQGETELLELNAHDFEREIARHSNPQLVVTVAVGDHARTALIRELQRDGITGRITHADFGEIDPEKKMHVHIPLVLLGDSVGVRTENGVLEQQLRGVEVVCLPRDVIEDFTVDVSPLHVGEDIKVSALGLDPEKYTLVTHGDLVVANVAAGEVEVKAADEAAPAPEANKKGGKKK